MYILIVTIFSLLLVVIRVICRTLIQSIAYNLENFEKMYMFLYQFSTSRRICIHFCVGEPTDYSYPEILFVGNEFSNEKDSTPTTMNIGRTDLKILNRNHTILSMEN